MSETAKTNQEKFDELQPWMLENLRTAEKGCTVVFTKVDGTERTMVCTLNGQLIPEDKQPKSGLEEEKNSGTSGSAVRVFDIEKQEWRSFRWDSVKQFSLEVF